MSKAFTKETDSADDDEGWHYLLCRGWQNYIPPSGYAPEGGELLISSTTGGRRSWM